VSGAPLPSARYVSKNLFPDFDLPSSKITLMFVYYGQFLDHDLTRTAITEILKNPDEGRECSCNLTPSVKITSIIV
jgi:peroxidase